MISITSDGIGVCKSHVSMHCCAFVGSSLFPHKHCVQVVSILWLDKCSKKRSMDIQVGLK